MIRRYDVMLGERYYHTLVYRSDSNIPPTDEELRQFVLSKLPTLKNKKFEVLECGKVNHGN